MAPSITLPNRRRIDVVTAFLVGQVLAGLLVLVSLFVARASFGRIARQHDLLMFFVLAIPFSQVTLLATWNALGDGRRALRPIGSLVCLVVIWLVGFGLPAWLGRFPGNHVTPGIAMFVQWIVVQVPLWIVRLSFGWRMGVIDQLNEAGGLSKVQFGIKHLIIWTTFVAIVLGLAKAMLRPEWMRSPDALGFGLFLICNSLFAWPTLVGSLANRWMPAALLAAGGFAVAVAIAEPFVFQAVLGNGAGSNNMFWWLNGIQFVWIAGSMLILRWFGFRLVRTRGTNE